MINLILGILAITLAALRLIECIYQLRQTPALNTFQKCWQIVVNFFKIEKYVSNNAAVPQEP